MLFVQEKCIGLITTYNVPRLLYHVRHSGHSAFRALGILALLTLGITGFRHSGPYTFIVQFPSLYWMCSLHYVSRWLQLMITDSYFHTHNWHQPHSISE